MPRIGALTASAWTTPYRPVQPGLRSEPGQQHLGAVSRGQQKERSARSTTGLEETAGSGRTAGSAMSVAAVVTPTRCHDARRAEINGVIWQEGSRTQ